MPSQRGLGIRPGMGGCKAARETRWMEGKQNIYNQEESPFKTTLDEGLGVALGCEC